jgi:hypothetical protein
MWIRGIIRAPGPAYEPPPKLGLLAGLLCSLIKGSFVL